MATIGSQGFVDDGSGNLTVAGTTTMNVQNAIVNSTTGSGLAFFPTPGFWQVPVTGSGAGTFTGSLPPAVAWPGADMLVTDSFGAFSYLLTGSMAMMSGSTLNAVGKAVSVNGTKLTVSAGGSVAFISDGKGWLVQAMSGTLTLAP